jgi:ribonuclease BN (tRNA processing enzyme)
MKILFYGTRGSIPIANPQSVKTGGNTTCLRVDSACLPKDTWLVVDAGSGMVPLSFDALAAGAKSVEILFTHWHHDHTQGLPLSPLAFIKAIKLSVFGPIDHGLGPREVIEAIIKPPFFPVDFKEVGSHFSFKALELENSRVILIHPEGGLKIFNLEQFENIKNDGKMFPIGKGKYPLQECMVIRMHRSNHPERTISYRFEEGPTGKVFTFLTDHENQDGIPQSLRAHLSRADLLVMDSQYPRDKYDRSTAGFGHATPDYCVRVALAAGAKRLGLTHHDPSSTDQVVEAILAEARKAHGELTQEAKGDAKPSPKPSLKAGDIFVCTDYSTVEV